MKKFRNWQTILNIILLVLLAGFLCLNYRREQRVAAMTQAYRQQISESKSLKDVLHLSDWYSTEVSRPLIDFFNTHAGYAIGG